MKINFSQELKNFRGEPFIVKDKDGDKNVTLEDKIFEMGALIYEGQPSEERVTLGRVAIKIVRGEELVTEDVSVLKKTASKLYGGHMIVAIHDALEGKKDSEAKKGS